MKRKRTSLLMGLLVFLTGFTPALYKRTTGGPAVMTHAPEPSRDDSTRYRDPLKWPFATNSIWNTSIGSNARYVHAGIMRSTQWGMTIDEDVIVMSPEARFMEIYYSEAGWNRSKSRCMIDGDLMLKAPVPHHFVVSPDTWDGLTPNSGLAVLMPDRRTIRQTQPFAHCKPGGTGTTKYLFGDQDLYGPGMYGAHGGSGLSAIGGALRLGELTPDSGPIRHVLKVNIFGKKNLYYDAITKGFRWPALHADGYAYGNYGSERTAPVVVECRMGALLALPPWINLDSLGFETEPARILAEAFRDYGAYVVDDTAWDVYGIITEWSPDGRFASEFQKNWGFSIKPSSKETPWARDMDRIFLNLHVVDNNSPENMAGGGERRMPPPPEFYPTGELTVLTDSTPGAIASPAGTFEASLGLKTRIAAYTEPGAGTFSHWAVTGGHARIIDSLNPATVVVMDSSDAVVQAFFIPSYYALNTRVEGEGAVIRDTIGDNYGYGTRIMLSAVPGKGYRFIGWSGDLTGSEDTVIVRLTGDMDITATFAIHYHQLVVGIGGEGSVSVEPQGDSIISGTEVTLTAVPDSGWIFRNWTGDLTSAENPLNLVLESDLILYATFDSTSTSLFPGSEIRPEEIDRITMRTDPANRLLHFIFPVPQAGGKIVISDLGGRMLKIVQLDSSLTVRIPTGGFGPGIYVARVIPDRGAPVSFIWVNPAK